MSIENVEVLIEEIVKQKIDIEFAYTHYENNPESTKKLTADLRNLCEKYTFFKDNYPQEHEAFLKNQSINSLPQYKFFDILEIFSKDTEKGLNDVMAMIGPDTTQTVINIIEYAQTNKCFQWLKGNNTQKIKETANTQQEKNMFLELGALTLPKIKREEFGDLIGLSMSGVLSANHEKIENSNRKVAFVRGLLAHSRKYITFNYKNREIKDETYTYGDSSEIYRPRGLMAKRLLDSSYVNKNNLFVTVCTNNEDVSPQKDHLFRVIHTLNNAYENNKLTIDNNNLKPSITFFNQAFFCTQDELESTTYISKGIKGGSKEVQGFHSRSNRKDFEGLLDNPMTKDEMDKVNGLAALAILGNDFSYPDVPHTFEISDIIFANPVTAGCSTMWLYKEFLHLQAYSEPKRTQKLFNFLLDYSQEVTQSLLKVGFQAEETEDNRVFANILKAHGQMISGICNNFTQYNLKRELTEQETAKIEKLLETMEELNTKNSKIRIHDDIHEKLIGLVSGGFSRRGKSNHKSIENYQNSITMQKAIADEKIKQNEEYYKVIREEKDAQTSLAISALSIDDKENYSLLKEKLTQIGRVLYDKGGRGAKINLGDYLEEVRGVSLLVAKTNLSFSTVSNYLSVSREDDPTQKKMNPANYFSKDFLKGFVFKVGTNNKVYSENSPANKAFKEKLKDKNSNEKIELLEVKARIDQLFESFKDVNGLKEILKSGGLVKSLDNVVLSIEKDFDLLKTQKNNKLA